MKEMGQREDRLTSHNVEIQRKHVGGELTRIATEWKLGSKMLCFGFWEVTSQDWQRAQTWDLSSERVCLSHGTQNVRHRAPYIVH